MQVQISIAYYNWRKIITEISMRDFSAMIDYVVKTTSHKKNVLSIVEHSQDITAFFISGDGTAWVYSIEYPTIKIYTAH